jgi:hypothetical protein
MENTRWSINGIIFRVCGSLERKKTSSQTDFLVSSVVDPQLFQCGSGPIVLMINLPLKNHMFKDKNDNFFIYNVQV